MQWPRHDAGLVLNHNSHKIFLMTVAESVDQDEHGYGDECWVNEEQRQKAMDLNDCWTLEWYPESPWRSCILSAADLDVLIAATLSGMTRGNLDHNEIPSA